MTLDIKELLASQLKELRLPSMSKHWDGLWGKAVNENWTGLEFVSKLCEYELADRATRRLQRHFLEARLPTGKGLEGFDYSQVHGVSNEQILEYSTGAGWLTERRNLLIFGPSGVGKTHLAAGISERLIMRGHRVHFTRTTELIERLQLAKKDNRLADAISKLDKFDCLVLDDFGYVKKDQQETNILFELVCERYERGSLLITCNQPFSEWDSIFADTRTATAATDRIVHEALILQVHGESYRRMAALAKLKSSIESSTSEAQLLKST